jgi:hypothetical protein
MNWWTTSTGLGITWLLLWMNWAISSSRLVAHCGGLREAIEISHATSDGDPRFRNTRDSEFAQAIAGPDVLGR